MFCSLQFPSSEHERSLYWFEVFEMGVFQKTSHKLVCSRSVEVCLLKAILRVISAWCVGIEDLRKLLRQYDRRFN